MEVVAASSSLAVGRPRNLLTSLTMTSCSLPQWGERGEVYIIIERIQSNMEVGVGGKDVNGHVNHGVQ